MKNLKQVLGSVQENINLPARLCILTYKNLKNVIISFQEKINKEKTAASKMLTAVHLLLELFLNECHLKMTISFVSICLMTIILKSPFRFIPD